MSPRRRQLVLHALFEIRGAFPDKMDELIRAPSAELLALIVVIEKALEGAHSTDPVPPTQT